jgi:hypothetical protein
MEYLQNFNAKNFDAYAIMKKEFEKHSFKLVDLTEYGTWKNYKLIIRKKGELTDAFSEMKYIKTKIDKKGVVTYEEKSFIKTWFDDPQYNNPSRPFTEAQHNLHRLSSN